MTKNINKNVVEDFGEEWKTFDYIEFPEDNLKAIFGCYFSIFPFEKLGESAIGFDLGCGTGRWAKIMSQYVHTLHCIEPAKEAINVARKNLSSNENCVFHHAGVDDIPLKDDSCDFGYSLGVLHHIPSTQDGIIKCVKKLKPGAPFLIYLYYAFDNRSTWFKVLWKISDFIRRGTSKLPFTLKYIFSQLIAILVYLPLSRFALLMEKLNFPSKMVDTFPLSGYRHRRFYVLRTDALDRFGTKLEHRFTKKEIEAMMVIAGLERIVFNDSIPYWCALGYKKG